mgnify:CR=1 FL=1
MILPMDERRIKISADAITVTANLNCKPTADALWDTLPFVANGLTWGDEIRAASPVNVIGYLSGDAKILKHVRSGTQITVEKISSQN